MRQRFGRVNARGTGAEAKFLQAGRVELAAGVYTVIRLKLLQRGDGVRVPLAVGLALIVSAAGQRGLDFRDAVGSGRFLGGLTPRTVMFGLFLLGGRGRRFCSGGGRRGA